MLPPSLVTAKKVRIHWILRNTCSPQDDKRNALNTFSILHSTSNVKFDVLKSVKISDPEHAAMSTGTYLQTFRMSLRLHLQGIWNYKIYRSTQCYAQDASFSETLVNYLLIDKVTNPGRLEPSS